MQPKLVRHPRKHATNATHASTNSTSFLKLNKLYELHSDLSLLPERKKLGKVEKLVSSLEDKSDCYSHKKFETGFKPRFIE